MQGSRFAFGPFVLDPGAGTLLRDDLLGRRFHLLGGQPLLPLLALVELRQLLGRLLQTPVQQLVLPRRVGQRPHQPAPLRPGHLLAVDLRRQRHVHEEPLGDQLFAYLTQLVTLFNTHVHPGELALGILPVTPAPPVAPMPPPSPSLLSLKVLLE